MSETPASKREKERQKWAAKGLPLPEEYHVPAVFSYEEVPRNLRGATERQWYWICPYCSTKVIGQGKDSRRMQKDAEKHMADEHGGNFRHH